MSPRETLDAQLLAMAECGQRPVCSTEPVRWISDDPEQRQAAALDCLTCPLLSPCRAAGEAECAGVWGGVDRSAVRRRRGQVAS